MKCVVFAAAWLAIGVLAAPAAVAKEKTGLADATVVIVRHGEKPDKGTGLSLAGEARARAYIGYFENLSLDGTPFRPDTLVASADSKNSARERLTLEPLAQALGLPIDQRFTDKDVKQLAHALADESHGKSVLIAWHHGELAKLIDALGADAVKLLPGGRWPDDVFNWVVVLRYDHQGKLIPDSPRLLNEPF